MILKMQSKCVLKWNIDIQSICFCLLHCVCVIAKYIHVINVIKHTPFYFSAHINSSSFSKLHFISTLSPRAFGPRLQYLVDMHNFLFIILRVFDFKTRYCETCEIISHKSHFCKKKKNNNTNYQLIMSLWFPICRWKT